MEKGIKDYKQLYKKFFKEYTEQDKPIYLSKIGEMISLNSRSLTISHKHLFFFDKELGDLLLRNPEEQLYFAEEALKEIIIEKDEEFLEKAKKIFVRVKDIYLDEYRQKIRNIRANYIGCLIEIRGVVTKSSAIRHKLISGKFLCDSCGSIFGADLASIKKIDAIRCINCGSKVSKILEKNFIDVQRIIVQEPLEEVPAGQIPRTIEVYLEGDIVDLAYPGNHVTVTGILKEKRVSSQDELTFSSYIHAINLEVKEKGFEEEELTQEDIEAIEKLKSSYRNIGDAIVDSIAPSIHGLKHIKKALALQLFGGVSKLMPDGVRIRGDIHICLVGDPGTAKTQLLRYMVQLAPKGIYTTGKGVSAAGLTAAVVRDKSSGEFYLEAGALVLADQGLAAIDEVDKMRNEDRVAMHEAMEQQTVSIAKAGIVATLNARCAILAAANPSLGRFERNKTIAENIDLPITLLSRFDLIFPIIDIPSKESDAKLASHILAIHTNSEEPFKNIIPPELLRKYVIYARKIIHPKLSQDAQKEIFDFYLKMREISTEGPVAITPRQLEALVRLTEAHARMNLRNEATSEDAREAINLMKYMMDTTMIDYATRKVDVDILMSGLPKSQRDKFVKIRDILKELNYEKEAVDVQEVLQRAEREGIASEEARKIIEKMKNEGDIFEPKKGFIKKTPS